MGEGREIAKMLFTMGPRSHDRVPLSLMQQFHKPRLSRIGPLDPVCLDAALHAHPWRYNCVETL